MVECFKCSIDSSKARIFQAISKEGLVFVCEKCADEEDIPIIKKPTTFQLKEAESPSGVYERLSSMAGIDAKQHREKFSPPGIQKREALKKQETSLREIIDKRYKERMGKEEIKERPDLIDNFHWVIMRVRRLKKLTQEQLAKEIGESEAAIKMAEKGILPEDYPRLISKLEGFLGIRIKKKTGFEGSMQKSTIHGIQPNELKFDKNITTTLTIADLKEMKAEQNTKAMVDEIEEDLSLNEEFKKKLEEMKKED